eukprot:Skav214977  [mRNA]  locus=scaffold2814:28067:28459:- [translate_table: standard]
MSFRLPKGPEGLSDTPTNCTTKLGQAIWATLGVGAAYVPIDPEYPAERIKHILENAQPKLMLCREEKRPLIDANIAIFTVETWPASGNCSIEQIEQAPPLHLAYVIYTSGSTGKPKAQIRKLGCHCELSP